MTQTMWCRSRGRQDKFFLAAEARENIGGLSYKEAAEVLEVPAGTLTSRLARGRDALQTMLGVESEYK